MTGDQIVIIGNARTPLVIRKIPGLKTVLKPDGTITDASSIANADGAAALILDRAPTAQQFALNVQAVIPGHVSHAQEPAWFTTAPVFAIRKLLDKLKWSGDQVDLFKIQRKPSVTAAGICDRFTPRQLALAF